MFIGFSQKSKLPAIMVLLIFWGSIFLSFINCRISKPRGNKKIVGIDFIFSYPIVQVIDNKVTHFNLIDTIPMVDYKDYILYHLPKTRVLETENKIQDDNNYFLYHKDSTYGLLFKPEKKYFNNSILADSFLKERGLSGILLQTGPDDTLIQTQRTENGNLLETYVLKQHRDNYFDSMFFYYTNNLNSLRFSFSKKMDSLKNMKIVQVRLIYNESFSSQYKLLIPKREFLFSINQMSNDSLKNYVEIIKEYSKRKVDSL